MMLWFLLYLMVIVALAVWRDHHDGHRAKKHRGRSARVGAVAPKVHATVKQSRHRTS